MTLLLVLLVLVVALYALRRATAAEETVARLRGEIGALQQRLVVLERHESAAVVPPPVPAGLAGGVPVAGDVGAVAPAAHLEAADVDATPGEAEPVEALGPAAAMPEPAPSDAAGPGMAAVPPAAPPQEPVESLEARIGSRWLLYVGVAAIVLGASYFIKYAFDNEWVSPPLRVLLGLAGGIGIIAAGQRFAAHGLERYGQALTGGGLGVLYLSIYAAQQWYGLIDQPVAFIAMALTTAAGAWLADRQRSQVLAIFAVTIGFFTPGLIGGESTGPVPLLGYLLLLVAGTSWLAHRRDWPALHLVSYVLTLMVLSNWGERYYERRQYLVVELFLTAFLLLFLSTYRQIRRSTHPVASIASIALALAPLFYHAASLGILAPHRGPFFVYLIAASVAGVITAGHLRLPWLRLLAWAGVALPYVGYVSARLSRGWLLAAWVTLLAIYGLHLIAQSQALDEERTHVPAPEVLLLHGNGLWLLVAVWALLAPRSLVSAAPVAAGLALFYGVLALAARRWHAEASLHATGLAAALAAVACAMYFSGPWLIVSLAAEGVVLVWMGLRTGRHWIRGGGICLLAVAVGLAVLLLAGGALLGAWPIANARTLACLFVVATLFAAAALHRRQAPAAGHGTTTAGLIVAGHALAVLILSAEIDAYYDRRVWADGVPGIAGETRAGLARQLTLSIAWAGYAVALIAAGLRRRYRPIRLLAIALLAVTIAKVFAIDLARLDRVYRMLSVIGLGLLLLMASYLYQRLRTSVDEDEPSLPSGGPSPLAPAPRVTPPSADPAADAGPPPAADPDRRA